MANMTGETFSKSNGSVRDFKNKLQDAEGSLEKMAHEVGSNVGRMASDIANTTQGYVKSGRDYVKENPAKGVAIAAAAGIVTGLLFSLASRRRQ